MCDVMHVLLKAADERSTLSMVVTVFQIVRSPMKVKVVIYPGGVRWGTPLTGVYATSEGIVLV